MESFVSTDGFPIFRGRNSKGNLELRKMAKGHDLWLHTIGGPGAHVLIRLAWPGQEVPESTLKEAGILAAQKSWQKDGLHADIQCAEFKHIKPLRGAAPGTVKIDKILKTFTVPLEPLHK